MKTCERRKAVPSSSKCRAIRAYQLSCHQAAHVKICNAGLSRSQAKLASFPSHYRAPSMSLELDPELTLSLYGKVFANPQQRALSINGVDSKKNNMRTWIMPRYESVVVFETFFRSKAIAHGTACSMFGSFGCGCTMHPRIVEMF